MAKRANLYLAKAGQAAAMAEFLARGWNVAVPEVDVGDDLFIVRDDNGEFSRIQVKTASGQQRNYGYSALFRVPLEQLQNIFTPELIYVFAVRYLQQWASFTLIPRPALDECYQLHEIGNLADNALILTFQYKKTSLICSGQDLSTYINNWSQFPVIEN